MNNEHKEILRNLERIKEFIDDSIYEIGKILDEKEEAESRVAELEEENKKLMNEIEIMKS